MSKGKSKVKRVEWGSADLVKESIARLKELFPEVVTEGKIDFGKLRHCLGDEVNERPERYSFTWAGKGDAIRLLQTPSRATLVPVPKESVNFGETQNLFIEGENLEVLKLLYKSYAGRVKMIYIDPPYNTGNDFIYPDNFADPLDTYLKLTGQKDTEGNLLTSNPEASGRYHSAWLTMIYPRLFLARQLLSEDGIIFVSIDDHEVYNLRIVMNEIFGEENFVQHVVWNSKYTVAGDATTFSSQHEHVLCYARNAEESVIAPLARTAAMDAAYSNPDDDPRGPWKATPLHAKSGNRNYVFTFRNGRTWTAPDGRWPRFSQTRLAELEADNRLWFGSNGKGTPNVKTFLSEVKQGKTPGSVWRYDEVGHTHLANEQLADILGKGMFDNPKPAGLIRRCLELTTTEGDLVMDFFAGSGTTAHAVLEHGRNCRFILVQLPEPVPESSVARKAGCSTIADICKERIRRIIKKLKDEANGKLDLKGRETPKDLGFKVFKLAESNCQRWRGTDAKTGEALLAEMEKQVDPLLSGWKPMNVIYELALKEGYSLTCSVEELKGITGNTVYRVADADRGQSFLICLDEKLKATAVRALGLKKGDLFICRDVALTDEQAANLALQCNLKTV